MLQQHVLAAIAHLLQERGWSYVLTQAHPSFSFPTLRVFLGEVSCVLWSEGDQLYCRPSQGVRGLHARESARFALEDPAVFDQLEDFLGRQGRR